jgi:hypothetical protein
VDEDHGRPVSDDSVNGAVPVEVELARLESVDGYHASHSR